jgi:hypothetical protein
MKCEYCQAPATTRDMLWLRCCETDKETKMETKEVEVVDMPMELTVFEPIDIKLAEAEEKNANLVFDYEDKKGNKEARSWVAHLRTLKAPVNEMHKTGKAEAMKYCKEWDKAKNKRIESIERMIEVHHGPIKIIEDREKAKKEEDQEGRRRTHRQREGGGRRGPKTS